jgi:hypothetical protein
MRSYNQFLKSKATKHRPQGFNIDLELLNPESFGEKHQFQPHIIQWGLRLGRAALFAKYGTGKTRMQLEWANRVAIETGGKVLILAPLAVARQTANEAIAWGIPAIVCENQSQVGDDSIVITNYDKLKNFTPSEFVGVVLDESSILKQYRGKTKEYLCKSFENTKYKLCCSATPAPNDYMEILNHSEFLGVMTSHLALSRWFTNDTMAAGKYSLKTHAAEDFWGWVSSWAVCLSMPSDLGFSDEGWVLPPLNLHNHVIPVDHTATWEEGDRDGQLSLIRSPSLNATTIHKEARLNCDNIAAKISEIVAVNPKEAWVLWCFTDYESAALKAAIPHAIELKGSELPKIKQSKLELFTNGEIQILITKPEIAGLGLNWQHAHHQAFMMGTSYSFELYHQALHRLYRFGQQFPVEVHLIYAETSGTVNRVIERKQSQYDAMQSALKEAVLKLQLSSHSRSGNDDYNPTQVLKVPSWLVSKSGELT